MQKIYPVTIIIRTVSQLLLRSTSTNVLPGRVSDKVFSEKVAKLCQIFKVYGTESPEVKTDVSIAITNHQPVNLNLAH